MNTLLIIFLIIVILFAILFAVQNLNPTYLIQKSTPLNILKSTGTSVQSKIEVDSFDSPAAANYFYEGWFFINENAPAYSSNVLFNRGNNFVVTLHGSTLEVYVNIPSQSKVVNDAGILDTSGLSSLLSVPNFPFQKWAHLVINVYGTTVDLYVDGKFVKNVQSKSLIQTNKDDPITYGNQYTIGNVTRFRRLAGNINPQGVWNSYMLGSGSMSVSNYHINAQILKNNKVRVDQRII